tara:strand:+ start:1131 stop:1727 length:597 start_codon:yes stop_codon:yes gene_type:complete
VDTPFPEEHLQQKCLDIIKETLQEKMIKLSIYNFSLREDKERSCAHVSWNCSLGGKNIKISGTGVGIVDALFVSAVESFSGDYKILEGFNFEDFSLRVKFKYSRKRQQTDAPVEIKIAIANSRKQKFYFSAQSRSLVSAVIEAIRKALEFLINIEVAILQLKKDYNHAKKRNRTDLIQLYTMQLSDLVRISEYKMKIK